MARVFIGIGGNIGDSKSYIRNAVTKLDTILTDSICSCFYITQPRDYLDQDYFLNVVVRGDTDLTPLELLDVTQSFERSGGRIRNKKIEKGPRTIDLDILLYGDELIENERLIIPHYSMKNRKFVLIPLLELEPDLKEPGSGIKYSEFLDGIEKQGVYCSSLKVYNYFFL